MTKRIPQIPVILLYRATTCYAKFLLCVSRRLKSLGLPRCQRNEEAGALILICIHVLVWNALLERSKTYLLITCVIYLKEKKKKLNHVPLWWLVSINGPNNLAT